MHCELDFKGKISMLHELAINGLSGAITLHCEFIKNGTEGMVVCSVLELLQVMSSDMSPNCVIILTLSNSKISKMKNGSFSGLSVLQRLPWSMLPPETMLMSAVHADTTCYGQGSFFYSGIDDCRLIIENERH
ncbi:hypothetical protein NN561_000259 [Cricetulus griseus]